MINFTDAEKAEYFDILSNMFYDHNFGTLSKAEIDLMMFRFYLNKRVRDNINSEGVVNYNNISDFRIAKELGLTPNRVRNLKVRCQMKEPINFSWQKSLKKLIDTARMDKASHKIIISIPDPNLHLEIQNYLEEHNLFHEAQLNSRLLVLRPEVYLALSIEAEKDLDEKKLIGKLKKVFKETEKANSRLDAADPISIIKELISTAENVEAAVNMIENLLSKENIFFGIAVNAIKMLFIK